MGDDSDGNRHPDCRVAKSTASPGRSVGVVKVMFGGGCWKGDDGNWGKES